MGRKPQSFQEFQYDLDHEGFDPEDIELFDDADLNSIKFPPATPTKPVTVTTKKKS